MPQRRRRIPVPLLLVLAALAIMEVVMLLRPAPNAGPLLRGDQRLPLPADLALPALDGQTWRLADCRGSVVLANFFATWCGPCRGEIPDLAALAAAHPHELVVVGIDQGEEPPATVKQFAAGFPITYRVLMPGSTSPWANVVPAIPTTMLVDRAGRIAKVYHGATPRSVFEKDLAALLAEAIPAASPPSTGPATRRFNPAGTNSVSRAEAPAFMLAR